MFFSKKGVYLYVFLLVLVVCKLRELVLITIGTPVLIYFSVL